VGKKAVVSDEWLVARKMRRARIGAGRDVRRALAAGLEEKKKRKRGFGAGCI
jgi:hypothetical protein